ncbi:hypothetical protein EMPG_16191 [Blastomyces silverae]|uniref:Uncharacterized protein n=1 Tax=Blastomyces silverae TaxID=2060906 RepID=A0A0H1BBA7_9EURO|nr:hypothetical protein EMPG_16191 [Blastomyces silverae]
MALVVAACAITCEGGRFRFESRAVRSHGDGLSSSALSKAPYTARSSSPSSYTRSSQP